MQLRTLLLPRLFPLFLLALLVIIPGRHSTMIETREMMPETLNYLVSDRQSKGGEQPLFTDIQTFNYSVTHRQSVCARQEAYHNRSVELRFALEGLQIRPWIPLDTQLSPLDPITGAIPSLTDLPGIDIEILDEVADRGRFTWRNSFGASSVSNTTQTGKTFDDVLFWAIETFDLVAASLLKTVSRINQGAVFPEGFVDASIIMVAKENSEAKINFWSFLAPFSWQVWLLNIATFVASGLVYLWMEWINEASDLAKLENKPTETIYFATLMFVGDNKFQPKEDFSRLFVAGLSLFSLMLASAYTANLASFFVVQNRPSLNIQTIEDAVRANLAICVPAGTAVEELVTQAYPRAIFVRVDTESEGEDGVYLRLLNADCTVAVTTLSSWDVAKGNSTLNPGCQLAWIGRAFKFVQGGFVTKSDSGTLCTSLIRDVFNVHLAEMEESGFTASLVEKYQRASADQECGTTFGGDESAGQTDSSQQLRLRDLGGLFIVYYVLVVVTILMALYIKCRPTGTAESDAKNDGEQMPYTVEANGGAPSMSGQENLLRQLSKLQRELDEAMRQASEMNRPDCSSQYST